MCVSVFVFNILVVLFYKSFYLPRFTILSNFYEVRMECFLHTP